MTADCGSMTRTTLRSLFLGTHVSIRGGLVLSLERGETLGCGSIQIFSHSSRTWDLPSIPDGEVHAFVSRHKKSSVGPVLMHASYLVNTATSDPEKRKKSAGALKEDWVLANRLGVYGLVLHPGSAAGQSDAAAIRLSAKMIRDTVDMEKGGSTRLLLENTAGGGRTLGRDPGTMKQLVERIDRPEKVGLCLDSCHLLASGAELRNPRSCEEVLLSWTEAAGPGGIRAWHLNDALFERGSGRDRHAHIGKGSIGLWFFWNLLRDHRYTGIPKVLETPKTDDVREDRLNLGILEKLSRQETFWPEDPAIVDCLAELETVA
ncbi:deoxyribonuclease IV [Leptospirillum ferriphilum]|uniref:deoxyribonuclease IV n=1 Tax=Leptospirillum ferriphilum TaxID=178606 RepID=UPI003EE6F876